MSEFSDRPGSDYESSPDKNKPKRIPLIPADHLIYDRALSFQFDPYNEDDVKMLEEYFYDSVPEKIPRVQRQYKEMRYGDRQANISYWRYDTLIFTVEESTDHKTGQPFYTLITIYDQALDAASLDASQVPGKKQNRQGRFRR